MLFYLGTHRPDWLRKVDVPLFVSQRRLRGYKKLFRALGRWALDSGGFTELNMYGAWRLADEDYVALVRRFAEEIGNLDWAAIKDWMCEPTVLQKTGKTVLEHQWLTIDSYLALRSLAPELPWVPVVQGWTLADYLEHVEMYARIGVDLASLPTVGVGSICRRQHSDEAAEIIESLASLDLRLHCFGLKLRGTKRVANVIQSADSMAWSYGARRQPPLPGCVGHKNCANCLRFALQWRERVVNANGVVDVGGPGQCSAVGLVA